MNPNDLSSLLIDRPEEGLFQVSRKLFNDEELFDLEMKHIFESGWVYLCHESQVAQPNDFFTTHIGRQPVVVTRNEQGEINCMINACAHRGATLCRVQKGNKKFHVCSYHGWTFDSSGTNVDVKDLDSGGYPDPFLKASHDLTKIAKLEVYKGFVFGSSSADVPLLEDYLAESKTFIEMISAMSAEGMEVVKGSSTYIYEGNWKMQAENGIDGYHFTTIHANYVGVIARRAKLEAAGGKDNVKVAYDDKMMKGFSSGHYDLHNGHAVIWIDFPKPENRPLWEVKDEVEARVGGAHAEWMLKRQRNLLVYPNVQLMEQASSQIRVFRPISYNRTEVKIYCIAPRDETPSMRERRLRQYEDFFNATGLATPDDLMEFEQCQRGYEGREVKWQQGYDRGMADLIDGGDEMADELGISPYSSGPDATHETLYHGQYRQWEKMMSEGVERDGGVD
ncbi:MAG: benzoate 1,2-dioxygenase large subunit [Gammaproteobacteria bacterium]|nr:MAG: benzoate 1,2-dioxygenase large subunit [Gammaproteobacteria bacterium]